MRERSITKAINDYQKIAAANGRDAFYLCDIENIVEHATTDAGDFSRYGAISDALKVGYAVGYKAAQRQSRQQLQEAQA